VGAGPGVQGKFLDEGLELKAKEPVAPVQEWTRSLRWAWR
jgi:hypothetical protein